VGPAFNFLLVASRVGTIDGRGVGQPVGLSTRSVKMTLTVPFSDPSA
jgi:hypothetical protein